MLFNIAIVIEPAQSAPQVVEPLRRNCTLGPGEVETAALQSLRAETKVNAPLATRRAALSSGVNMAASVWGSFFRST
jgi:hypothetical protein